MYGRFFTIEKEHVGKVSITALNRIWAVADFAGRIFSRDVGKRVYLQNGVLCMENEEQYIARLERGIFPPQNR